MTAQDVLAICVAAGIALAFTVTVLSILLAFRDSRRKIELDHAARIKSIELGRPLPGEDKGADEPWTMAARLAMAIGVVVPLGALGCAFLASFALGFHQDIWIMGGMVGLAGVICGGVLASQALGANKNSPEHAVVKPYVEEDAYDVVAARG